jgi:hypothetical protein
MTTTDAVDRKFDALSHRYRRDLLVELAETSAGTGDPIHVDALVEAIDTESDGDRVLIELHHNHLPKLEAFGYVQVDRDNQTVAPGPNWAEIAAFDFLRTADCEPDD